MSCLPAVPVVLGEAVLDRDDRVPLGETRVEVDHLAGRRLAALEAVDAVAVELARRRVERDRNPLAMAGALGGLEDRLDRGLARLEVGREAALVADRGREPALVQHPLSEWKTSTPIRSASAKVSAPAGTTMNSCRSIEFSACAPPLITFSIGTGSVVASSPPR